jgi:hypothetical protein
MKINPWVKTTIIATLGGGIASMVAAAMDPTKWRFPQDLGSGKLWPFFFEGAGAMLLGLLIKSPIGQQLMTSYKESQTQLADGRQAIEQTKADLKAGATPAPDKK